jgi:hypothetical protein
MSFDLGRVLAVNARIQAEYGDVDLAKSSSNEAAHRLRSGGPSGEAAASHLRLIDAARSLTRTRITAHEPTPLTEVLRRIANGRENLPVRTRRISADLGKWLHQQRASSRPTSPAERCAFDRMPWAAELLVEIAQAAIPAAPATGCAIICEAHQLFQLASHGPGLDLDRYALPWAGALTTARRVYRQSGVAPMTLDLEKWMRRLLGRLEEAEEPGEHVEQARRVVRAELVLTRAWT